MDNCAANESRVFRLRKYLNNGFESVLSIRCGPVIELWDEFDSSFKHMVLLDQEPKVIECSRKKIVSKFKRNITYLNEHIMKYILSKNRNSFDNENVYQYLEIIKG